MQIEDIIKNKKVLMIPVYSTRSYATGKYDLLSDGNISKFLMKILYSDAKEIDILIPINSINLSYVKEITKGMKISWIPSNYGVNAHETRNMNKEFLNIVKRLYGLKKYDYIISEIDSLAYDIAVNNYDFFDKEKFIYWAGSWNADGTPWYESGHEDVNKTIANNVKTACLLKGQVTLYGGKSFYDECIYKPEIFDYKIIFFPFRLSDKSYKLEFFKETIHKLNKEGYKNFKVLYTDPNDSHLLDGEDKNIFIKVSSNKFIYQSILKGRPIIPYLDDVNKNYHSNIFEFVYYNCDVIMHTNDIFTNVTFIEKDDELYKTLKTRLED